MEESAGLGALLAGMGAMLFVCVAIVIVMCIGMAKVYTKAGQPGIAAFIPIWNLVALCEMAGKSPVWVVLLCIPFVNFICSLIVLNEISKAFGKGGGFTLVLILFGPIGWMILGFGSAQYTAPAVTA